MKQNISILLVQDEGGWAARAADVLDVYAFGKTREQACFQLQEAVRSHLEIMQERGLPIPEFTSQVSTTKTDLFDPSLRPAS
jgi:predicted RNase H-like HicB family nuclease